MGETFTEQRALIEFAARLGTSVSHEDGISNEGYLRSEAELLMNLLVSNPTCTSVALEEHLDIVKPYFQAEPSCEQQKPLSETQSSCNFSFSCPSLSLDAKSVPHLRERSSSDGSLDSIPELITPAPVISMGRPLVVEDRDALRLSCEAMARNILRTFQKAVQWRKECWVESLARPLVDKEQKMKKEGATEQELKELLDTPEAVVIASLNQSVIEVLEARTSFRVLPQLWDHVEGKVICGAEEPPMKKFKVAGCRAATMYKAAHVLSFQAVLNLMTPAGYSEVNLEAPGFIEGTFTNSADGVPSLVGVSVQVDTKVLSAMIEKSSRIIARVSAENLIGPEHTESEASLEVSVVTTSGSAPFPSQDAISDSEGSTVAPTIVTPRMKSPPHEFCDIDADLRTCIPLPEDLDDTIHRPTILRMVSPQPCSIGSDIIYGRTPIKNAPSLVSPYIPPSDRTDHTEYISFDSRSGPSLPALVEVACAAMHAY